MTTQAKALVLDGVDQLAAWALRVSDAQASAPFRLFIMAPGCRTPLVVTGPDAALQLGGELVEIDLDTLPIAAIRDADHPAGLVGAVATSRRLPAEAVLWCRDEAARRRLIRASLATGHDAIQTATGTRPTADGTAAVAAPLLRIAPPGWYTLDLAHEEDLAQVYVPASATGSVWTLWGTEYPLADHVDVHGATQVFLTGEGPMGSRRTVAAPVWDDVYQMLRFELSPAATDESWAAPETEPARFTIPLRFVVTHRTRTPAMWILGTDGRDRLEQLLGSMDESDADQLQFALQRDAGGREYILLRERHAERGRQHIDFPALALAPWHEYQNLFVPVDRDIEPLLRRDKYREVFGLQPRRVTAAWEEGPVLRVVHVAEASFEPLTRFVDYIVGEGAQVLQRLAASAVFDFGRYRLVRRDAPATERPLPAQAARPSVDDAFPVAEPEVVHDSHPAVSQPPISVPKPTAAVQKSALEEREIELETEIIIEGQSPERWRMLRTVKSQLGHIDEAALCAVEAMWLGDPPASLDGSTGTFAALWAQTRTAPAPAVAAHWLTELRGSLATARSSLRKKERWLLWERLFEISPDPVGRARVREELLDEMADTGLRPQDIPGFIQRRTYETRFVTGDGSADEIHAAREILELVGDAVEGADTACITLVGRAILAYAAERLGDELRAADLRDDGERAFSAATDLSPTDRAWLALYMGAGLELYAAGTGCEWLAQSAELREDAVDAPLGAEELAKVAASLLERGAAESPTAFLAAENFRALYPSEHKYADAIAIQGDVEQHIRAGEFDTALALIQAVADDIASGGRELELRQLAWLLGHVVSALTRVGRAAEGTHVLSRFAEGIPEIRTVPMRARLYCVLARIKLGEGFLEFGDQQRGMDWVCDAVRAAWDSDRPLVWLDHLDMLSAALAAIESAPVEARAAGVGAVIEALFLNRPHDQDTPDYRHIKLRLLDHCLEVGLSKERLSMKRYKRYVDEDEYHVRSRIVRRTP